jgi:hypothetical protein
MYHNRLQLKLRIISIYLVFTVAALAIASVSLATYTPIFAAPALNPTSAGAIKVSGPLKELCLVPANNQTGLGSLNSNSLGNCTVSTSASSPALNAPKSSSAVDPLSFSVATLESMRWRNAALNAARSSSENPLSFSAAALESMIWRSAASSNTIATDLQRSWAAEAPSLTIEAAIYNSRRNAASSNSTNPLSFSVATLESMRWRLASRGQTQSPR